jgi:hypothetical protein
MHVTLCDICKKRVEYSERVSVAPGGYAHIELCRACAKPVIDFLRKKKLVNENGRIISK